MIEQTAVTYNSSHVHVRSHKLLCEQPFCGLLHYCEMGLMKVV